MKEIVLVICAQKEYAIRLQHYILTNAKQTLSISVFSSEKEMYEHVVKNKIDIVMMEEELITQRMRDLFLDCFITLVNDKEVIESNLSKGYFIISKYQSSEKIYRKIWDFYSEVNQKAIMIDSRGRNATLIGIYSPVGRCFQTTFAMALGQILAKKSKVLYINLESFSGFYYLFQRDYLHDFTDLFYYFNTREDKGMTKLISIIENINGLDYIPPPVSTFDLQCIEGKQWIEFLTAITTITGYEYVLLDLSDVIRGLFDILQFSDHVFTITKDDKIAKAKINQYEKMLQITDREEVSLKTTKCTIPYFTDIPFEIERLPNSDLYKYVTTLWESLSL